ncbi:MAG: OmpH family outer membrane protein [Saprospiraceae bacterium]
MKRITKLFILVLMMAATAFSADAQKFGYLNSAEILSGMAEVKQANSSMEALQKQLQKKGQQMVQAYQTKLQDLQKKEQAGELSPKQIEDEAAKLKGEEEKMGKFQQDMDSQIREKQNTLLQPIFDRVNSAIKDVAKENGYSYVFDRNSAQGSTILYADETQDVTTLVKAKLGL